MTILCSLEENEPYEYNTAVVWIDNETGQLFAAHDAGCSCPEPFERYGSLSDLTPIRSEEDFDALVRQNTSSYSSAWKPGDVLTASRSVREYLWDANS